VVHVAKKYYAQPSDQEDLISIGTIGLMKAVDTFDSTRKARFSTYASRCIEKATVLQLCQAVWLRRQPAVHRQPGPA
jgi:RNA polymerase sigma factor (sigma-70 family)